MWPHCHAATAVAAATAATAAPLLVAAVVVAAVGMRMRLLPSVDAAAPGRCLLFGD